MNLRSRITLIKVAFTGSTYIGQVLRRATAGTGKKLSLELGGKSPVIIFDDCDLDSAVEGVVDAIWFNQGQVCSAGSRILIQETVFEKVVNKIKHRLQSFRVGNSLDKVIFGRIVVFGPLTTVILNFRTIYVFEASLFSDTRIFAQSTICF